MRILLSGSTGLLGSHLVPALRAAGHTVTPLVRSGGAVPGTIPWQVDVPLVPAVVSGFDAVIHLAGEPVLGRWSVAKKRRIQYSRAAGTRNLATALAAAAQPPRVFLCASGINIYGDHGDCWVTETTPAGQGFLPDVCRAWEAACDPLRPVARVVNLRIGVVLTPEGGMLASLLPLFRLGLGPVIDRGEQYLSWIGMCDFVAAVLFLLKAELAGLVNVVGPEPVPAWQFARELAAVLHRPQFLRVPAPLLRVLLGQFAEETMLSSVRAVPQALEAAGFSFAQPQLRKALEALLTKR